ncbi:hypothetical protein KDK95_16635 [Actinospica sp. MGRD01-02]|uniref:Uncharacterized protein n=1 Tax=Actinospica acidithermotolerans TaxID=2828514 RepID=A0A941E7W1_9ACTN|nr:hypothetical protein [Actinospica acidithermotolerans]MBR7827945.1 hypothetical protein [Actinospica acidithermotolerans]
MNTRFVPGAVCFGFEAAVVVGGFEATVGTAAATCAGPEDLEAAGEGRVESKPVLGAASVLSITADPLLAVVPAPITTPTTPTRIRKQSTAPTQINTISAG